MIVGHIFPVFEYEMMSARSRNATETAFHQYLRRQEITYWNPEDAAVFLVESGGYDGLAKIITHPFNFFRGLLHVPEHIARAGVKSKMEQLLR